MSAESNIYEVGLFSGEFVILSSDLAFGYLNTPQRIDRITAIRDRREELEVEGKSGTTVFPAFARTSKRPGLLDSRHFDEGEAERFRLGDTYHVASKLVITPGGEGVIFTIQSSHELNLEPQQMSPLQARTAMDALRNQG